MRRLVLIPAVMAAVVLGADAAQLTVPLTSPALVGVLVDSACYATRGPLSALPGHTNCAMACARKGHRLAIVTVTGDVFMVIGELTKDNNAKLIPLMNQVVAVTGTIGELLVQDGNVPTTLSDTSGSSTSSTLESNVLSSDLLKDDSKGDGRRPSGSEEGVVATPMVRKGDFREGDVKSGVEKVIDAISIDVVRLQ